MKIKIMHLNVEKDRHLQPVSDFIEKQNPDIACFVEILESEAKKLSVKFGYEFVYSSLISTKTGDTEGTAILSKMPIVDSRDMRYDDNPENESLPTEKTASKGNRQRDRFLFHSSLLAVSIDTGDEKILTVATTHFPVTDHTTPGYEEHSFDETTDVQEINHTRRLFDRFISIIKKVPSPLVFTADLNNPRGEYMYDTLAHELIDLTPKNIDSTIDPNLHRKKDLNLVVDTIMTSSDIKSEKVEVFEGVSDHKSLVATLEL